MAGSVNKVILIGRVGQDPETKNIGRGEPFEIAEFSLATSKTWRDRGSGERKEKTTWHRVKIMNDGLVKGVVRPYVKKGSLLYIEGELEVEQWEKDGEKRSATKVVVSSFGGSLHIVGGNGDGDRQGGNRQESRRDDYGSRSQGGGQRQQSSGGFDADDDVPF